MTTKNWETTANRFVLYIDILGYKDLLIKKTPNWLFSKMRKLNEGVLKLKETSFNNTFFKDANVDIQLISDSIFIFSKDDIFDNYAIISIAARKIANYMIEVELPFRGAIAYGSINVDRKNKTFVGFPIVDVVDLTEDMNCIGIVAHHSFENQINQSHTKSTSYNIQQFNCICFPEANIPFKKGNAKHRIVNYFNYADNDFFKKSDFKNTFNNLKLMKSNCSGSIRSYYDNTLNVISDITSHDNIYPISTLKCYDINSK